MKKFGLLILILLFSYEFVDAQGTENFTNLPTTSSTSYIDRTWTGTDLVVWTAAGARTDQTINGKAICWGNSGTRNVISPTYANGIGTLQFSYVRGFTGSGTRSLEVFVNNILQASITVSPSSDIVQIFSQAVDISGAVVVEIRSTGAAQVKVDDISWTSFGGITPAITVTTTILNGFNYVLGSGPSISQSYNLSGTNLTGFPGNIFVTGSSNYEVSLDNTSFVSSVNVPFTSSNLPLTTIYVRLKTGLPISNYNGELISNTGGSATTVNVTCNGNVTAPLPVFPVVDEFNYTAGTLLTNNGWSAHSGAGTNPIAINNFGLSYTGYVSSNIGNSVLLATSGEDVNRIYSSVTSGFVYAAFLVNVSTSQTTGDYFFHLGPAGSTTSYYAKVFVKKDPSLNNYAFGIAKNVNTNAIYTAFDYLPGTVYLVVVRYKFNSVSTTDDEVKLWVNPVLTGTEPSSILTQIDTSADASSIGMVALRQGTASNSANLIVDGIRISDEWVDAPMPVELTTFSATTIGKDVKLSWNTSTEVNNYGFEIERASSSPTPIWNTIGFVNGNGNSNSPKDYSFVDDKVNAGKYSYRLKQIDNDGQFEYSKTIQVDMNGVKKFELTQNYPNPFNPTTTISYILPQAGLVKLTLYNILGQELRSLVNEVKEAGTHSINFNASDLNSGVYVYKIESGSFTQTKKMTLVK
jgi:hypothetical protein